MNFIINFYCCNYEEGSFGFSTCAELEGGKMFGYESKCSDCLNGNKYCTNVLTVFWIPITQDTVLPC